MWMVWRGPSFMNALKLTKSRYQPRFKLSTLITMYFQWDYVALEPLSYQNLSHGNYVLTASGHRLRKPREDVRKDENVVSSTTGGFQLCEVYGQDLKRATGEKMAGGGVDHWCAAHSASLTVADVVPDLPYIPGQHTRDLSSSMVRS